MNPLLQDWNGPGALPPFAAVRAEHFAPAFEAAMAAQRAELEGIARCAEPPSFANTAVPLDASGRLLGRVEMLFGTLNASLSTPELQAVQRQMAAPLAAHASWVAMHQGVFERLEALMAQKPALDALDAEQRRLLERLHLDAVRAGAKLAPAARERYAAIMQRLAELNTQFAQNVMADEGAYRLVLRSEAELAGLPPFARAVMREAARERGLREGDHLVTLSRSHIVPFLTFSARRDLREAAWRAWVGRGEQDGPTDNRGIAREILTLRNEQARLHGHASFADYQLLDTMAQTKDAVQALLMRVWNAALGATQREREAVQAAALAHGVVDKIEAWDWRFYAEKVRQARYALDEAELKPYFPLDAMVAAMFDCAQRLFGLRFERRAPADGWPAYHPDVQVYEVFDADGQHRAVFLHDNFARMGKRSGAWMNALRWYRESAGRQTPVILNTNNFAKAAPGEPTLLSLDDVRTLFHEFGHGLHGMLSTTRYERLSGTQVLRDFVELPSQLMEHWIADPAVMQQHARHWQTGAPIPAALIERIKAAELFNQGYETVRYTASALVDLAIHALEDEQAPDVVAFERQTLERLGAPADCGMNHRLPHFQHLFVGDGYAAGYYVYLWAEVLDCDAFEAFKEAGDLFHAPTAQALRKHILASGNSVEPGAAFRAFRGRDPVIEPMLRGRGLLV